MRPNSERYGIFQKWNGARYRHKSLINKNNINELVNNGPDIRLRQTGNSQHRFQGHTFGEHRLSNTQRFGPLPLLNALKSTFPLPLRPTSRINFPNRSALPE
jgi:hypothetical protein